MARALPTDPSNRVCFVVQQVKDLKAGKAVQKPIYNHVSGKLDDPEEIKAPKVRHVHAVSNAAVVEEHFQMVQGRSEQCSGGRGVDLGGRRQPELSLCRRQHREENAFHRYTQT